MPFIAATTDDLRSTFRRVMVVRQVATAVAIAGFALMAVMTGEAWLWDFMTMLVVFAAVGFVVWGAGRWVPASRLMVAIVLVDVALVAFTVARTPHPAQLAMAFVAIVTAATVALPTRWAVVATIESVVLGIGLVASLGTDDDLWPMVGAMTMLAAVAVVLIGMQRDERVIRSQLERSERRLQRAEAVARLGSWQWCPSTNELVWSRNMYRLVGLDPDGPPVDYERWTASLDAEGRERMERNARAALETGTDYVFDSVRVLESGDRQVIQARGSRMVDEDGVVWLIGTAQDVTDLRQFEEQQDEFVATASHELRTPATIVLGFVRTLDDRWDELDDDTRRRLVTQLRDGGERMSQLIEDILNVTRIEHGDLRITPRTVSIREAVAEIVAELGNPRVGVQVDPSIDGATVLVDPERLRQVLFNLVENALRYDRSGEVVTVEVGPASGPREDQFVRVNVRDHGPGIAEGDRDRIFGRFVRGASSAGSSSGTGLGLYVARSLVQQQGGELWLEEPDEGQAGSVFGFTVPRA